MRTIIQTGIALILLLLTQVGCGHDKEEGKGKDQPATPRRSTTVSPLDVKLADMFSLMRSRHDTLPTDYSETFEKTLQEALRDPATFDLPFDSLVSAGIGLTTSDDGRIRVFHWIHPGSGQYWYIPAIVQARTVAGTVVVQNMRPTDTVEGFGYWSMEHAPIVDYHKLYHLTDSTWLVTAGGQAYGTLSWVNAFGMHLGDTGIATQFPFFERGNDTLESEVSITLTWYGFHPDKQGHVVYPGMEYDPEKRELSFPEMVHPAKDTTWIEELTGRTIRLYFNGKFFE